MSPQPVAVEGDSNPFSLVLGDRMSERMKRVMSLYAVGAMGHRIGRAVYQKAKARTTYTVAVLGSDPIYGDVHAWLLRQIPPGRRRALVAKYDSGRSNGSGERSIDVSDTPLKQPGGLGLLYDGHSQQTVTIDGHRVAVQVVDRPGSGGNFGKDRGRSYEDELRDRQQVMFTARSATGQEAVVEFLAKVSADHGRQDRPPKLRIGSRWGGWNNRDDLPPRKLESVVLVAGVSEDLVADVEAFLSHEQVYARMGAPWHRGYLLKGPPGTGKTSLARAIADHFRLDVYYLPLSDVESDSSLLSMIAGISARSMLLLEDIDIVTAARDRTDEPAGITMTGLLNALDGVMTPHGLITVMTSNHAEVLDDALLRKGRIDKQVHVGPLAAADVSRLVRVLTGLTIDVDLDGQLVAPVDVVEIVKRHLDNLDELELAMLELAPVRT